MKKEKFVGTWDLVSLEAKSSNGETEYSFGKDPFGRLMYDADGHMSVVVMRRGRSKFASGDLLTGTSEEIREAFEGFEAYCGTYEIDAQKGTLTHHIIGSRLPTYEDTHQLRHFRIEENRMTLISPPIRSVGQEWILKAEWKRIT